MQSKKENLLWVGTLIFLACYFSKFLNMHNLLVVALGTVLCGLWIVEQKKLRIDVSTCLLLISMMVYTFNYVGMKRMFTSHYLYEIMIFYVLAHYLAKRIQKVEDIEHELRLVLSILVLGITLRAILNSYMFLTKQWEDGNIRVWKDFWTCHYRPGTLHVNYYLPAIACLFPSIMFWKKNRIFNSCMMISCLFLIGISVVSQSRMPVLFLPIVFVCQFIVYTLLEPEKVKKLITRKTIWIAGSMLLIGSVSVISILCFTEVGQAFGSVWGRDGGIFHNVRFEIQRLALQQLLVYPLGGNKMDHLGFSHAHNLWLDMGDWGGLPAFIAYICYTLITSIETLKLVKETRIVLELKVMILGLYLSYFMFFMVEPGLQEELSIITPWLFLHGLVHGLVKES